MSTNFELHFKKGEKMELIDVVDENNQLTGKKCGIKELHSNELWYRAVAVIVINSKNELLLQKRAPTKMKLPNTWSITQGHVDSGESIEAAVLRETQEELGIENLKIEDFKFFCMKKCSRKYENIIDNHFKNIFILKTNLKPNEFILQKDEVSEVKYFTIDELKNICQNREKYEKNFTKIFFDDYFLEILENLEKGGK